MCTAPDPLLQTQAEKELARAPIGKLFRKFAIPGVVALLFVGLQTIIDGIVLGNVVGANALGSVNLILPCYSFIASMAVVMGVGCQTLVSINLGRRNRQGANDALASALVFIIGFSSVLSIPLFAFAHDIARFLGANEALLEGSVGYLRALTPFFPLITAMFLGDYILKAIGYPIYSMVIMSGTVIVNIILDIAFVKYLNMNTAGAGLATGIAFTLGALCTAPYMLGLKKDISALAGRIKPRLIWEMMYNGSSEGVSELSAGISIMLFNMVVMQHMGEQGVAAFSAINYIFFIGVTVFLGISDGIIPIISYNFGAGSFDRIRKTLKLAMATNAIVGVVLCIILLGFGEQIAWLFFKEGEDMVLAVVAQGTSAYAFAFLLIGLNILSSSYFTAIANAKISVIISLSRGLLFVVVGITVFPRLFGSQGIWFTIPFAELCTFGIAMLLVRRSLKKQWIKKESVVLKK